MGRPEDLLARIVDGGENAIAALIEDRQSEELFLDFKQSSDRGANGRLSDPDRKNLAKAISGFGNSEGGLVVWGVDCRPTKSHGDVARSKVKIENAKRFKSLLEGHISGLTLPPHPKVEHVVVEDNSGTGFVVTSIPKSYLAPHQSIIGMQYYMRAGSDFTPVPHGVLAGMFGRVPQPNVFRRWLCTTPRLQSNGSALFQAGLALLNRSSTIAENVFVTLSINRPKGGSSIEVDNESTNRDTWLVGEFVNRIQMLSTPGFRLAPEFAMEALMVVVELRPPFTSPLKLEVVSGCSGAPLKKLTHIASPESLAEAYENFALTESKGDGQELVRVTFGGDSDS
jgi:hypothetical protein